MDNKAKIIVGQQYLVNMEGMYGDNPDGRQHSGLVEVTDVSDDRHFRVLILEGLLSFIDEFGTSFSVSFGSHFADSMQPVASDLPSIEFSFDDLMYGTSSEV